MKKILIAATLATVGLMACNHEVIRPTGTEQSQTATKGEEVDMTVDWVKNKENSVDALVWLTNHTTKPVFTTASSYKLTFNGTPFTPRADQGLVQIPPGQKMRVLLVFEMPQQKERAGKAVLNVDPIYQGSVDGDSKTKLTAMRVDLNLTGKAVH